jgi:hypothetical protein
MSQRSTVYWLITVAELALALCAVTSFAWGQQDAADADTTLASAVQARQATQ